MHKDKPPGIFEFTARPVRHAVAVGLATGVVASILTYIGTTLWGADASARSRPATGPESLEEAAAATHPNVATPTPSAAVRY